MRRACTANSPRMAAEGCAGTQELPRFSAARSAPACAQRPGSWWGAGDDGRRFSRGSGTRPQVTGRIYPPPKLSVCFLMPLTVIFSALLNSGGTWMERGKTLAPEPLDQVSIPPRGQPPAATLLGMPQPGSSVSTA